VPPVAVVVPPVAVLPLAVTVPPIPVLSLAVLVPPVVVPPVIVVVLPAIVVMPPIAVVKSPVAVLLCCPSLLSFRTAVPPVAVIVSAAPCCCCATCCPGALVPLAVVVQSLDVVVLPVAVLPFAVVVPLVVPSSTCWLIVGSCFSFLCCFSKEMHTQFLHLDHHHQGRQLGGRHASNVALRRLMLRLLDLIALKKDKKGKKREYSQHNENSNMVTNLKAMSFGSDSSIPFTTKEKRLRNCYVFVRMTLLPSPTELQGWFGKHPNFSYLST
jgi:hypothetical protein